MSASSRGSYRDVLGSPESVDKVRTDLERGAGGALGPRRGALAGALAVLDADFKREVPDALGIDRSSTLTDDD